MFRKITQSKDIITLSFDDSIEEKGYTDQIELNCWHAMGNLDLIAF
jgi:hypothetical protein